MKKMSKLENVLMRLVALSAVLFIVFHFMLDQRFGNPPELEDAFKHAIFPKINERGIEQISLTPGSIDSAETGKFEYDLQAFHPAFGARNKEVRLLLAEMYGGGEDTENAVELGINYLAGIQNKDGSWSSQKYPVGSTGLVMLTFLGAGYHHLDGPHKETVKNGIEYLLDNQAKDGRMKRENLYTYGIAGTAFAEGYGLTGDPRLKKAALNMVDYLAKSQGPKGGWGYGPYREGTAADAYRYDTSVTGWIIMFFKSADMVGLPVPKEVISKYKQYALLVTEKDGLSYYCINKGKLSGPRETMTASTLMCRLYIGDSSDAKLIKLGLDRITKELRKGLRPKWRARANSMNIYLWYHAAQAAFLAGRGPWKQWNDMLKDLLIKNQIKDGPRKGAWKDEFFAHGNRSEVYVTTLNIMILETYYRYYR